MLSIYNDPSGATGAANYRWDYSVSIQENIARHLDSGASCEVYINAERVDPATDDRMERLPTVADQVRVCRRPEGFDPLTVLVAAAVAALIVSVALIPKPPSVAGAGKDSPNNSLTAQSNVARAYQAIPDVYGFRRVWPDLIQPSTIEYINHIKYVTEWLCVSRGEGVISAVQYAETPITDIVGASYEVFPPDAGAGYPERRSTTLRDVFETFASDEVNGQEIVYPSGAVTINPVGSFSAAAGSTSLSVTIPDASNLAPLKALAGTGSARVTFTYGGGPTVFDQTCAVASFSVSGSNATFIFTTSTWSSAQSGTLIDFKITPQTATTYTTIGPYTLPVECSRIRWNTVFLRGLKGTVAIKASWWKVDSGGVEVPGTRETQTNSYTADTYDARYYTNTVTPAAGTGRYRCEFTRQTNQIGDQGTDVAKLEELYAVRYYATKTLPGVTVIRVTTKATNEATGFSDRKFNLRWLRKVRALDSDTLSTSRNFARAMAHVWTLAGYDISGIDVEMLAEINDRIGEDSALLRFDGSLDDADMSLGERMALIANHARCLVWRDGTKWTVSRDEAKSEPDVQFDYRNLASNGNSTINFSAQMPDSHDGVEVEFVDEATQSKKSYIRLTIAGETIIEASSSNPQKIKLTGCTTRSQAMNRAQLEVRRLLYQRETFSDIALADAGSIGPGSLVRYIDPNDFAGDDGLQGGEVMAISGLTIRTSEPLDWKDEPDGRLIVTDASGRSSLPVKCYPVAGDPYLLTVESLPSGIYVADRTRQCGSRYAFGPGLSEAEIESAGLFTITSARPDSDGSTVSIASTRYDARLYEFDA
ncbi:host specificity factor TipJ family phage tail protein [Roseateles sp.]|uniref:host specificity factor TipJ family phage tail protein n=1 Tax=Roseateles sp. TaxID=1971397 RepID=UPI0031D104B6